MPTLNIATPVLGDMAEQLITALDGGTGPGTLKIYSGTMPESLAAVTDQVLLATLTLSDPCGTVTGNTLTFAAITEDESADASATATWGRFADGDGVSIMDADAGNLASDAVIKLNTTTIVEGGSVRVTSATVTVG